MAQEFDRIVDYGKSLGWKLRRRTILVEGTTDAVLFDLAAHLELQKNSTKLLEPDLAIVAAGEGDQGGAQGVTRQLITLSCLARTNLMQDGRPRFRFIGLFDNDNAGRHAVKGVRIIDNSILEYKDVFRLRPIMPTECNRDPRTLRQTFDRLNSKYKGLDWELEDLLSQDLLGRFLTHNPSAVVREKRVGDKIHRDYTADGKARLHRYVKHNAKWEDLIAVVDVVKALRFYLYLPKFPAVSVPRR